MEVGLRHDLLSDDLLDFYVSDCDDKLFLSAFLSPAQTKPTLTHFAATETEKDIEDIKLSGIPRKTGRHAILHESVDRMA